MHSTDPTPPAPKTGPAAMPGAKGPARPAPATPGPGPASDGKRVTAFFDMDRTLLRCNSGSRWLRYLRRNREITLWQTLRAASWLARYKLSMIDMEVVTGIIVSDMKGLDEQELHAKIDRWCREEILAELAPRGREMVEWHREQGHLLAILSSSTQWVTEPVARELGIEHVLCTRPLVADGRLNGTYEAPACYGQGKVTWAERFAVQHDVDLDASWFYTDSYTDMPMLRRVGIPRIINPDTRLRMHAQRVGWPIELW